MYKIEKHPILDIPQEDLVEFLYEGKTVKVSVARPLPPPFIKPVSQFTATASMAVTEALNVASANAVPAKCLSMARFAVSASPKSMA